MTKLLEEKGYSFKSTSPFGGHIVGVSSEGRLMLDEMKALARAQDANQQVQQRESRPTAARGVLGRLKDLFSK